MCLAHRNFCSIKIQVIEPTQIITSRIWNTSIHTLEINIADAVTNSGVSPAHQKRNSSDHRNYFNIKQYLVQCCFMLKHIEKMMLKLFCS